MFDIKPIISKKSNKKSKKKIRVTRKNSLVKSRLKSQIRLLNWYYKQERKKRLLVLTALILLILVILLLLFKGLFVKNYCESRGLTAGFGSIQNSNEINNNPFEALLYSDNENNICGDATKENWAEKPKYDLCKKGCPSSIAIDQNGKVYSWACLYQDDQGNNLNSYCQAGKTVDGITNFYYQQQEKINTNQTGQSCSVFNKAGDVINNLNNISNITNSKNETVVQKNSSNSQTNVNNENNNSNSTIIQNDNTEINQKIENLDQTINELANITPVPTQTIEKINGSCGSNHQKVLPSQPTNNLCASGVPSKVTNLSTWFWVCYGLNDGENDHCYSQKIAESVEPEEKIDGVCGSSHNQTLDEAPTQDLCASGTPSNVIGGGPWYWDCLSSGGGQPQKCQAQPPEIQTETVVGACGPAHTTGFYSTPTIDDELCSTGVSGKVSGSGPWNWSCYGTDLLNSDLACEAYVRVDGVCGSDDGTSNRNPPTNLCSVGTASSVHTEQTEWSWTCEGEHGGIVPNCERIRIIDGVCGSSHNQTIEPDSDDPDSNLCSVGDNSSISKTIKNLGPSRESPVWQWTCSSVNGGNVPNCYTCSWNYEAVVNYTFYMTECRRAKICPNSNGSYNTLPTICPCCIHGGFGTNPACSDTGC